MRQNSAGAQLGSRFGAVAFVHRHGHLDSVAVHTLDAPDHAGGWSVDDPVTIPCGGRLAKLITPPRTHNHRY